MILVFKRNNWRENGHLVFFAFAVNKMFDHSIFAEPMFLASWLKQEKFALKAKFTSREKNCF